jgi:hypothetical protein
MNTRAIDHQDVISMIDAVTMTDRGMMIEDAVATTTDHDTTTADAVAMTIDDTTTADAVVTTIVVRRDGIMIAETTDRTRRAREVCATRGGKESAIAATRAALRTLKTHPPATLDAMIDAAIDRLKCASTGNAANARAVTLAASCTRVNNALNQC